MLLSLVVSTWISGPQSMCPQRSPPTLSSRSPSPHSRALLPWLNLQARQAEQGWVGRRLRGALWASGVFDDTGCCVPAWFSWDPEGGTPSRGRCRSWQKVKDWRLMPWPGVILVSVSCQWRPGPSLTMEQDGGREAPWGQVILWHNE